MSQKPQPDPLDAQPAAPNSTQAESHDSPPVIYIRRLNAHDPTPIIQSRRASIWGTSPIANTSQVNSQELFPALRTRRVSIQEPLPSGTPRWVSTQEPLHPGSPRRVSIQEPLPPGTPRRVSIQEPPPPGSPRRVSIQEPPPPGTPRRVSIQEPPPPGTPRRVSIQEPPPSGTPRRVSIRDASALQSRSFSSQTSSVLGSMDSTLQGSSVNVQNYLTAQNRKQSLSSARCSIEVPPSITHSPEASISSIESVICDSLDSLEEAVQAQLEHSTLEGTHSFTSVTSIGDLSSRFQKGSHQSLLPICWRLLHEAKKITRYVSLVLTLAGLLVINLISLGQPWLHFQVPLRPPGDPAGPQTIPIDTIIFVRCPDISCLHEFAGPRLGLHRLLQHQQPLPLHHSGQHHLLHHLQPACARLLHVRQQRPDSQTPRIHTLSGAAPFSMGTPNRTFKQLEWLAWSWGMLCSCPLGQLLPTSSRRAFLESES
ncbi:uncharacterized protein [Oryctolagus cuniculus]|uniref:uncharacterized protein isoform X3 n=1 Tax=Oryctolagus cuniculus TaxID=9986 RepID=UPI0038798479